MFKPNQELLQKIMMQFLKESYPDTYSSDEAFQEDIDPEHVKAATEFVSTLQRDPDAETKFKDIAEQLEYEGDIEDDEFATQYAAKGAKIKMLRKKTSKCSCGCDMVTKKVGGKILSTCSCKCGGKIKKHQQGGFVQSYKPQPTIVDRITNDLLRTTTQEGLKYQNMKPKPKQPFVLKQEFNLNKPEINRGKALVEGVTRDANRLAVQESLKNQTKNRINSPTVQKPTFVVQPEFNLNRPANPNNPGANLVADVTRDAKRLAVQESLKYQTGNLNGLEGGNIAKSKESKAPINNKVKEWQQKLIAEGFNVGKAGADGKWGKDTEAAYQAYMKNRETLNARGSVNDHVPFIQARQGFPTPQKPSFKTGGLIPKKQSGGDSTSVTSQVGVAKCGTKVKDRIKKAQDGNKLNPKGFEKSKGNPYLKGLNNAAVDSVQRYNNRPGGAAASESGKDQRTAKETLKDLRTGKSKMPAKEKGGKVKDRISEKKKQLPWSSQNKTKK